MPCQPDPLAVDFERLIEYFQRSSFEYLALEHAGSSLQLRRAPQAPATPVPAPSVGVVEAAPGHGRLPRPGEPVSRGQTLLAIRRFKSTVQVEAQSDGRLASLDVQAGTFVEFGQRVATIEPA